MSNDSEEPEKKKKRGIFWKLQAEKWETCERETGEDQEMKQIVYEGQIWTTWFIFDAKAL